MTGHIDCVLKIGGSLFDLPDLEHRFVHWIAGGSSAKTMILIAGCGELADVIRERQERFHWSDEESHAMCLELLDVAAANLQAIFEYSVIDDLESKLPSPITIFRPRKWLTEVEPHAGGRVLPQNWLATTDSIAARVANVVGARKLFLLKSTLPSHSNSVRGEQLWEWAGQGVVDEFFPLAVGKTPVVRLVNLRDPAFPERVLND